MLQLQSTDWVAEFLFEAVTGHNDAEFMTDYPETYTTVLQKLEAIAEKHNTSVVFDEYQDTRVQIYKHTEIPSTPKLILKMNSRGEVFTLIYGHLAVVNDGIILPDDNAIAYAFMRGTPQYAYSSILAAANTCFRRW